MKEMKIIEQYANEIPKEIRRAIRGLDSTYRAGIFVALLSHGELSFTDLQGKLELGKPTLTYHLRKLIACALVEHYYKHELGAEQYSFYSVTRFGQNFVEALSDFLRPEPYSFPIREENSTLDFLIERAKLIESQSYKIHGSLPSFVYPRTHICDANTDALSPPKRKTGEEERMILVTATVP